MQVFSALRKTIDESDPASILKRFASRILPVSEEEWKDRYIVFLSPKEVDEHRKDMGFPDFAVNECINDVIKHPKIDAFDGLLYGVLNHLKDSDSALTPTEMAFFLTPAGIIIVSDENEIIGKVKKSVAFEMEEGHSPAMIPEKTLFFLMDRLVNSDQTLIRTLDEAETLLEERLLAGEKLDYPAHVFRLRQKTLLLTQYAGLMVDLLDVIGENDNELVRPDAMKLFRLISVRLDRLERSAATLRESVMQLREAYQSQVDIEANQLMRLFTVVSTIFLPLTVITGWFGMNFRNMPELYWQFGYPMVAILSVLVTGGIIYYCKKHKYL